MYSIVVSFVLKSISRNSCCYEDAYFNSTKFESSKMSGIDYYKKLSDEFTCGIKCLERAAEGWIFELAGKSVRKKRLLSSDCFTDFQLHDLFFSGHSMRCRIGLFAVVYWCCTCIYCKIPLSREAIAKKFTLGTYFCRRRLIV